MIITSAERALALYQSCYKSLKKIRQLHSKQSHNLHGASLKNVEPPTDDTENVYTINTGTIAVSTNSKTSLRVKREPGACLLKRCTNKLTL